MRKASISSVQPGDVIGFAGCSSIAVIIQLCSLGLPGITPHHLGIACRLKRKRRPFIVESVAGLREPCDVTGKVLDGVQAHYLRHRVTSYEGRVYLYRLKPPLDWYGVLDLAKFCELNLGVAYDGFGAIDARDTPWAMTHRPEEDVVSYFCSEWVAACLRVCGRFSTDNVSQWSPRRLCQRLIRLGVLEKPKRLK